MSLKKEKDIHNFITCIVILGQVNIVLMAVIFSFAIKLKLNFRSEVKGKFDNWILVAMFVKMFALGIAFRNPQ